MADRAGWLGVTRGSWPGDSGGRAALSFRAERERSEESRVSPRSMVLTRGARLNTIHNLHYYLDLMREARAAIEQGRFFAWADEVRAARARGPD